MDEIVGQNEAVRALDAALSSGRLAHAHVFAGPEGVGKRTTALAFARVLLCHDPASDEAGRWRACGACAACRAHETGAGHPDLHVVRKELALHSANPELRRRKLLRIPVDLLRERMLGGRSGDGRVHEAPAHMRPHLGHRKVFVVDEAELLDDAAQNALLKTLEEPPAGTHLILVTSAEDRLGPTIRSRCQRVGFAPLDREAITAWAERYAARRREAIDAELASATQKKQRERLTAERDELAALDDAALERLRFFAGGSIGRAELALRFGLLEWQSAVLPALDEMAAGRFSPELGKRMRERIEGFAKAWVEAHDNASKDAANRRGAELMLGLVAERLRDGLRARAAAAPGDPAAGERAAAPWLHALEAVHRCEGELAAHAHLGLACDHLAHGLYEALAAGRRPASGAA